MLQHTFGSREQTMEVAEEKFVKFDAATAVKAIVFHLIDENLAKAVAPETIMKTVARLTARSFNSCILRSKWACMTNAQRLQWLLTASDTLSLAAANDVVLLKPRRGR